MCTSADVSSTISYEVHTELTSIPAWWTTCVPESTARYFDTEVQIFLQSDRMEYINEE